MNTTHILGEHIDYYTALVEHLNLDIKPVDLMLKVGILAQLQVNNIFLLWSMNGKTPEENLNSKPPHDIWSKMTAVSETEIIFGLGFEPPIKK